MNKYLFLLVCILCTGIVYGQEKSIFDQFMALDNPECRIITDYKYLIRNKAEEKYIPGLLLVKHPDFPDTFHIEVRTRGVSRKQICYFPPLKVKFSKKEIEMDTFNDIKVVNTCRTTPTYDEYLIKEYLIYKLYNILTDKSLRAQLINMVYDHEETKKPILMHSIILESEEQFAARFESTIYAPKVTLSSRVDSIHLGMMTIFQYLIANTDWAIGNQHNCFVIRGKASYPIAVPYDFDYAGIVGTDYAVPHESLPIKDVKERYNRGKCLSPEAYKLARKIVLDKKAELLGYLAQTTLLEEKSKRDFVRFLEESFEILENEKMAERIFTKDCRTD